MLAPMLLPGKLCTLLACLGCCDLTPVPPFLTLCCATPAPGLRGHAAADAQPLLVCAAGAARPGAGALGEAAAASLYECDKAILHSSCKAAHLVVLAVWKQDQPVPRQRYAPCHTVKTSANVLQIRRDLVIWQQPVCAWCRVVVCCSW